MSNNREMKMTNEKRESKMRKKNKNKKIKGLVLKSFIVIAVVMMLISVMQGERKFYMHKIHNIQKGEYDEYFVS